MSFKCMVCGINDVMEQGGICMTCSGEMVGRPNYDNGSVDSNKEYGTIGVGISKKRNILINTSGNAKVTNDFQIQRSTNFGDYSPVVVSTDQTSPVSKAIDNYVDLVDQGDNSSSTITGKGNVITGICQNLQEDRLMNNMWTKVLKCMFSFKPVSLTGYVTSFQVYQDYTGQKTNLNGYVSDQIVMQGKITRGTIVDNNSVEVYGNRGRDNIIYAVKVINTATGSVIRPDGVLYPATPWIILFILSIIGLGAKLKFGYIGLIVSVILMFFCVKGMVDAVEKKYGR